MIQLLIIDDEPVIRKGIIESVDWASRDIHIQGEADNGDSALKRMAVELPDIALVDVVMPKIDGLTFCETCKREYPQTRLIIVSGYEDFKYAQRAIRAGVDDYLLKPVGADQLLETVSRVARDILDHRSPTVIEAVLKRWPHKNQGNHSEKREKVLCLVLEYIESSYLSGPEIQAAAHLVGVTVNHLCKVLRVSFGLTFTRLVNEYKIEVSKGLVKDAALKLYEVADLSGFSDYRYFLRVFRQVTCSSPEEFRLKE